MAKALLINPWITDFTAYDLWSKPIGLLYLANLLKTNGVEVELLDCLDRRHSLITEEMKFSEFGTGKYTREIIEKPEVIAHIPRYFARYGVPYELVKQYMLRVEKPDIIAVTSGMTYWYPGVWEMVSLCKEIFPQTPVILGGIYATILPGHAKKNSNIDFIAGGPLNQVHLNYMAGVLGIPLSFDGWQNLHADWSQYEKIDYLVQVTSNGCPYHCDFCASSLVSGNYLRRPVEDVFKELRDSLNRYQVRDVAFYDDALFVESEKQIKPLLREIIKLKKNVRFHTPNGVHSKMIDPGLAALLKEANFASLRLSFESDSPGQRDRMDKKISSKEFFIAFENLINAGFKAQDIQVYLMAGLPGQSWEEVLHSVDIVHQIGARVSLNMWSPIEGTQDYKLAVERGIWEADNDPLLCNPSCAPNLPEGIEYADYINLMTEIKIKNAGQISPARVF